MNNNKNIHGLGIPEGYFEVFENNLFIKILEEELPKENGFSVPEGYLNEVENKIISQLNTSKKEVKVVHLFTKKTILYAASIAAVAILIFSIFKPNNPITTLNDFDITSVESYIENEYIELNSYDLSSLLTDEDIENISFNSELISEEQLEEYLLDNLSNTSILTE